MNKEFRYGAVVLLSEDDTPESLLATCRGMSSLSMNTVVIWPPVFYHDGERDYTIQKMMLDAAGQCGMQVIIELTGQVSNLEYLPDCRYRDEFAVKNPDGTSALMQNGLGELNYNHPGVKKELRSFFRETVAALKDHPVLLAWDLWNETHFKSYDRLTVLAFQEFLQNKYRDIAELNRFWHKSYSNFNEIRLDPVTWASIVPDTDWEEFRTDNLAAILKEWADIVKSFDSGHPVIADNVMSNVVWSEFDRGTDDWKVAKAVDYFGISFYPKTGGRLLKINEPWLRSMTFAGAAAAGGGEFMISELQSHYYSEIFTAERVAPDELISWNLEALFQNCRGSVYWKYEPFKSGFQLGGRGLVLADGTFSKRAHAAAEFGEFIRKYPDAGRLRSVKKAAMLYDRHNNFAIKAVNNRVRHLIGEDQAVRAGYEVYRTAYDCNVQMAIVTPADDFSTYELLVLPYQMTISETLAAKLAEFMERGGRVAAAYPFGDISEKGTLYADLPGGPANRFIGARMVDCVADTVDGQAVEVQELETAGEVIKHTDGGLPYILRRKCGNGEFYYCSGNGTEDYYRRLFTGLNAFEADSHIEYARGESAEYLLVANYENQADCRVGNATGFVKIFGEGELIVSNDEIIIRGAKNCVLQRNI